MPAITTPILKLLHGAVQVERMELILSNLDVCRVIRVTGHRFSVNGKSKIITKKINDSGKEVLISADVAHSILLALADKIIDEFPAGHLRDIVKVFWSRLSVCNEIVTIRRPPRSAFRPLQASIFQGPVDPVAIRPGASSSPIVLP